jgi:hypothetical protein
MYNTNSGAKGFRAFLMASGSHRLKIPSALGPKLNNPKAIRKSHHKLYFPMCTIVHWTALRPFFPKKANSKKLPESVEA